jgi:bifunctional DNA-binding transcriptional regulator/antitoxin component of YhaV-PrlF toxin-antitoxin module
MGQVARIEASGRLELPKELLARNGLTEGAEVVIEETGDGLVIRRAPPSVAEIQAITRAKFGDRTDMSVDDFLADRRAEALRSD